MEVELSAPVVANTDTTGVNAILTAINRLVRYVDTALMALLNPV
jgi:hypothetical protein